MPEGGTLTVALRSEDNQWLIGFSDTGCGLSGPEIEKIFEPFQSSFPGGTGFGLAIVYQIVQAHAGKISVRSTPGHGTEFTLRLRHAAAEAAPATQATAAAAVGKGARE
jgi:signal transduction histidine kinase